MSKNRRTSKPHKTPADRLPAPRFKKVDSKADSHRKEDDRSLKIDVVVIAKELKPDSSQLPPVFRYFRRYNLMKLKIEDNRLALADLQNLQACGWLYMAQEGLTKPEELTLTALVRHFTPEILAVLAKFGFEEDEPGIFRRDSDIPAFVISMENMPEELSLQALQAFSERM